VRDFVFDFGDFPLYLGRGRSHPYVLAASILDIVGWLESSAARPEAAHGCSCRTPEASGAWHPQEAGSLPSHPGVRPIDLWSLSVIPDVRLEAIARILRVLPLGS